MGLAIDVATISTNAVKKMRIAPLAFAVLYLPPRPFLAFLMRRLVVHQKTANASLAAAAAVVVLATMALPKAFGALPIAVHGN
jgi:hypothetical protein